MTPSTKHAVEDCLRTTSSHGVVFCPEEFQGTFPPYLTATSLRVIADSMDHCQPQVADQKSVMAAVVARYLKTVVKK